MRKNLLSKLKESVISVVPVAVIILVLGIFVAPVPAVVLWCFAICSVILVVGMTLFGAGAEMSMLPIGEAVGNSLTKTKKVWLILICSFFIGVVITIAEPDLAVLAASVPGMGKWSFILFVAIGFGVVMVIAIAKVIFNLKYSIIISALFVIAIVLMFFAPQAYVPISFDAGTVTTGPISTPFIIAFGMGISAMKSGKSSEEDSLGLIGLCSLGPVIAILIFSLFTQVPENATVVSESITINSMADFGNAFGTSILGYMKDVVIVLSPILAVYLIFQFTFLKMPFRRVMRIFIGMLYTYVGIVIFLSAVTVGFVPVGALLGVGIAGLSYNWILLPLSCVLGFFIVFVEPAVHMLNSQVERLTNGVIKQRTMMLAIAIGVTISMLMSVLRALYAINFMYFVIPIYTISIILAFVNKQIFTSVAFDAGGVANGTMSVAFRLPFIAGIVSVVGGDVLSFSFGMMSLVAGMPILIIQIMGFVYLLVTRRSERKAHRVSNKKVTIVEYDW